MVCIFSTVEAPRSPGAGERPAPGLIDLVKPAIPGSDAELKFFVIEHGNNNKIMIEAMQSALSHNAVEPFFIALILLLGFAIARARGGKQKLANLLVVCAFMGVGLGIGFALGISVKNSVIGGYIGSELMWALGSIAAIGRIRKNKRFASIDATGVAY